tara:strand:- start:8003 stop:11941 length:3939 start_codon:yes stop_codon:yes gene_type:complete
MASSQSSYEQNLMPLVYIDKITLENNSAPSPPSDNPHIVDTEADVLRSQQLGIPAELSFRQTVLAEAQAEGGCEVTVDMILKDNIENTALSSWFHDAELLKYMHLKIIQSTSNSVTQSLIAGQFTVLETAETSPYVEVQVMELSRLNYESIKDFYSVAEDGRGKVADIPYQAKFFLDNANPSHLAYFSYCFFDIQQLIEDYALDMYGYSTTQGVLSKSITSEIVINNGSVVSMSYVFYLPSGKLWTGPVHQHNGVWMVGLTHTSDPHSILTRQTVINSTVQDFRDFDAIIAPEINLDPLSEIETLLRNLNIMGSPPIDGKESAFFSDAYIMRNNLSSNSVGGTSLLFSFDINEFMKQKSIWGKWLYDEDQAPVVPKILSLKVYRHRAKSQTSYDRLGSPVAGGNLKLNPYNGSEEPPVLVIDAHGNADGSFASQATTDGSIRQVYLEGAAIRSFMVTDYSLDNVTDGLYQYSAEVQIQDGASGYLTDILNNLRKAISHFQTYYDLSTTPDYYDVSINQFKTGFLNHYGLLNLSTLDSMPWVEASARLLETLTLMSEGNIVSDMDSISLLAYFMGLCNPQTGTPKGVYAVLKAMESVETSLAKLVGDKSNLSEKSGGFGSSQDTILIDTQRFTALVDSEIPDMYGQSFLGLTNVNTFAGPPVYIVDDYINRIQQENEKYFSIEGSVLPSDVNEAMSDATTALLPDELRDLSAFGATYLTTIGAVNGTNTLTPSSNVLQDIEKYRKFSLPLLMAWLKSPGNPSLSVSDGIIGGPLPLKVPTPTVTVSNTTPASMKYLSDMGISFVQGSNSVPSNGGMLGGGEVVFGGITDEGFIAASTQSLSLEGFAIDDIPSGSMEIELPDLTIADELASSFASDLNLMQDTNYEALASFAAGSPTEQLEIGMFHPIDVDGLIEGVSSEYLRRLPNQIKSLFLSGDPSIAKYPWLSQDYDVIRSPDTALMFIWNYQNIAKVEYLSSYESATSGTQVASPQWRELTFDILTSTAMSQSGILCRLIPYYDTKFKIGMSKYAQLPYYENYFIIAPSASSLNFSSLSPGTTINFLDDALALWNSFSDVTSSSFMSTVPDNAIPLNSSGDVEYPYTDPFPGYEGEVVTSLADALYDEMANICSAAIVTTAAAPGPTEEGGDSGSGGGDSGDGGGTGGGTGASGPPVTVTADFPESPAQEDTFSYNPEVIEGLPEPVSSEGYDYTEPTVEAVGEYIEQQQNVQVSNSVSELTAEESNDLVASSINQTAQVNNQSLDEMMSDQEEIEAANGVDGVPDTDPVMAAASGTTASFTTPSLGTGGPVGPVGGVY